MQVLPKLRKGGEVEMLTIRKIKYNYNTECNSCGKVRKQYYEICYGIPVHDFPWQPYSTLPLCRTCLRRLSGSIEKKLSVSDRR
jgi:ribosomal protein S14